MNEFEITDAETELELTAIYAKWRTERNAANDEYGLTLNAIDAKRKLKLKAARAKFEKKRSKENEQR